MKNLILYSLLFIFFIACESKKDENGNVVEDKSEKTEAQKKITKRDFSITPANSYNDLFLDSTIMETFIAEKKLNDTITRRMRSFYNARNYQFAWFATDGLTEQARGFWNLHNYATTADNKSKLADKVLKSKMDDLTTQDDLIVKSGNKSIVYTELALTQHFIQYVLNNFEEGIVKRKELERFVPRKKEDALMLADSLLTKKHKDNKYFEDANEQYKLLKQQLKKYYDIAKNGDWQPINSDQKKIKLGTTSPTVLAIKKRLQATGEMPANDTTAIFNEAMEQAVKTFQTSRGLTPDGIVTSSLIKELNVPAAQRVQQILVNMDRMRWMPAQPKGNLILVNIPEFVLHIYEGKNKVKDMDVVVGKEGHNTMMFTGNLNQVVFSPYWNVTPDITRKEVLPAMAKNPNYLANNNMEIVREENGIPVVRQLPGPENSLGKVKFLFPNDFNIYFHDTPAKSLFGKDKRAFSHGCIRLSDPVWMANYLLRDNAEWTPERIEEAMNSGKEKYVKVKKSVPVFITYYTAWVDESGLLNFRDDIYKHDAKIAGKMFTNDVITNTLAAKK
jgi:murein L,D-transpeptidase YcbB/YkuD